jgi:hypothetical protein
VSRYRIRMNGNGEFIVERKGWLFWRGWREETEHEYAEWLLPWRIEQPDRYDDSETACKALLASQEHDQKKRRDKQWSVVVEDK